jgi:hypothetical protein
MSDNVLIAGIDASGTVSGFAGGTATITYTTGANCATSKVVTVNPGTAARSAEEVAPVEAATIALYPNPTNGAFLNKHFSSGYAHDIHHRREECRKLFDPCRYYANSTRAIAARRHLHVQIHGCKQQYNNSKAGISAIAY